MAIEKSKLQLETRAYHVFLRKWGNGDFKGQRFGQAFHNHFNMHKVISVKDKLDWLYQLESEHQCKELIKNLFKFN